MSKTGSSRPVSSKATRYRHNALDGLCLPPIPPRRKDFPETTSREIGWKSVQNGQNSEMVTRYAEQSRGKCTIFRKLKWPKDCLP
ncbi:hypothetical protein MAR_000545 [Mya arenaria]|uniref:Uncharacterized protein n=2 Tax=Mya arenaria TaxID=6604 RepID=A0ABY7FAS1_MYAAR|nr:hypothetical protein MAR_000545 [Mya arenaria]